MLKAIKLQLENLKKQSSHLLKLNTLMNNILRSSSRFLKKTSISCSQVITMKSYIINKY